METVQGGVPPYGVKETLVVNGKICKVKEVTCLLSYFVFPSLSLVHNLIRRRRQRFISNKFMFHTHQIYA